MPGREALSVVLVVQMALAFLCPPLPFGGRLLFPSDLWAILWVGTYALFVFLRSSSPDRGKLLKQSGAIFFVAFVIFIHGKFRPSLAPELRRFIIVEEDDLFHFRREAMVAARFFAWGLGALLISRADPDRGIIEKGLIGCLAVAVGATVLTATSVEARSLFGSLFHYDPAVENWADRSFGSFQSPIEACATYSLGLLLVLQSATLDRRARFGMVLALVTGIFLTRTLTSFVAAATALVWAWIGTFPQERRRKIASALVLIAVGAVIAVWNVDFFAVKRLNLAFRMKPWLVYWENGLSRPDSFLFGNGFIPHFSDNIWVFFFSRGGVFLVAIAAWLAATGWNRNVHRWGPVQRSIPVFFLISGMAIDILILRPVIYIMLGAGIAALSGRDRSTRGNER